MANPFFILKPTFKKFFILLILLVIGFFVVRKVLAKPSLTLVKPEYRDLNQTISLSGQILADNYSLLKFQSGGRLANLNVAEGQVVTKGKVLASLDTVVDLGTVVNTTYNSWLAADAKAKKVEDDVKGHDSDETFTQKSDRVAAQTARDTAYANWQLAQKDLRNAFLIAPFSGMVTHVNSLVPGSNISLADSYVEVLDPKTAYFSAEVDETDLSKIRQGQKATINLDAYSGTNFDSTISYISYTPKTEATSTVYEVRFAIPTPLLVNQDQLTPLRFGLNGDAQVLLASVSHTLSLPVDAVRKDNSHPYVLVLKNGHQVKQTVQIGLETDDYDQILSGVTPDDQVIVPAKNASKK